MMTAGKMRLTSEERKAIESRWKETNIVDVSRRHVVTAAKLREELAVLYILTVDERFRDAARALDELKLIDEAGSFKKMGRRLMSSEGQIILLLEEYMKDYEPASAYLLAAEACMIDAQSFSAAARQVERVWRRRTKTEWKMSESRTLP